MQRRSVFKFIVMFLTLAVVTMSLPVSARGDIYVANFNPNASNQYTIGEYTNSGATVNASLIASGLSLPNGLALSGSDLFVSNYLGSGGASGSIGNYSTSGATENATLVSGLDFPIGMAVSGSNLFVANSASGVIGEYTTSGKL